MAKKVNTAKTYAKVKPLKQDPATLKVRNMLVLLMFIGGLLILDRILFTGLHAFNATTTQGKESIPQAINTNAQMYIFGDSRAEWQYDPNIFKQHTGMTCFNAGAESQDIYYYSMLADLIQAQHKPKVFLVNISLDDLMGELNRYAILNVMAPYIDDSEVVKDIVLGQTWSLEHASGDYEHAWQRSVHFQILTCARFNAKFYDMVCQVLGRDPDTNDGYSPHEMPYQQLTIWRYHKAIDHDAYAELGNFIKRAHRDGIKVVFCLAPYYRGDTAFKMRDDELFYFTVFKMAAEEFKVPFITIGDDDDERFKSKAYYTDVEHLNAKGAAIFSTIAAQKLRSYL